MCIYVKQKFMLKKTIYILNFIQTKNIIHLTKKIQTIYLFVGHSLVI